MNPTRLPKYYKICISIILTIMQVNRSIEVNIYKNYSISAMKKDDHSPHLSRRYRRIIINDQSCEIPNYPNSTYQIVNDPETMYKPGNYVGKYSILEITCNKGYKLPPSTTNTSHCLNGRWTNEPPACLLTCPSLMSTTSTTVKCKYDNTTLDNCIHPVEGTYVHLSCNLFYEADAINRNPTRKCQKGRWAPSLSECYATCGLKTPTGQSSLIINDGIATPGDYPWHVGIYDKASAMFLCSGSIIDQNIILSAAHCLADYDGKAYPADKYLIGAGKYHRQYNDVRDVFPQYSAISKIFIPNRYRSTNGLNGFDIALVILENPFTLTIGVQPVCVALNEESQNTNYFITNNGTVISWGNTQEGSDFSDVLKELIIPHVQFDKCYNKVPETFRRYIMFDKICGGYLPQRTSVCQGDSGGGLVYNINNHYFVKGIVSTSVSSTDSGVIQCNSHQYGLYTSVYYHIDFVRDIITTYGWKEFIQCTHDDCTKDEDFKSKDSCRLPNFPLHGTYSFSNKSSQYESGNYVLTGSVILLTCDPGYQVNPSGGIYFSCVDKGNWNPTVGSCTESPLPPDANIDEINEMSDRPKFNFEHELFEDEFEEFVPSFANENSSDVPTTDIEIDDNPSVATQTRATPEWVRLIPTLIKSTPLPIPLVIPSSEDCGITDGRKPTPQFLDVDEVHQDIFPWMAAIMTKIHGSTGASLHTYKCTGSLVSNKHVITAGHCLKYQNMLRFAVEDILVIFGKVDLEDWFNNDQLINSKVSQVSVHPDYSSENGDSDVAVITLSKTFKFTPYLRPICIWNESDDLDLVVNQIGTVAGWSTDKTVDLRIASLVICILSNPKFRIQTTSRAFYAGNRDGKGPYNADSGTAFMMKRSNRWTLRGIASRAINDSSICDHDHNYLIFADIAKMKDWLRQELSIIYL